MCRTVSPTSRSAYEVAGVDSSQVAVAGSNSQGAAGVTLPDARAARR
jgi:hypothetical protein